MLGKRLAQLPGTGRARGRASEAAPTASVRAASAVAQRVPPAMPESGRRAPPGALWSSLVAAGKTCGGSQDWAPFSGIPREEGCGCSGTWSACCQHPLGFPGGRASLRRVSQEEALGQPGLGRKLLSGTLFSASIRATRTVTSGTSRTKTAWAAADG